MIKGAHHNCVGVCHDSHGTKFWIVTSLLFSKVKLWASSWHLCSGIWLCLSIIHATNKVSCNEHEPRKLTCEALFFLSMQCH
jgi:hypothetical protein